MESEILWEAYFDIKLKEQMDALKNIYKKSSASKKKSKIFRWKYYTFFIVSNTLAALFIIYFWPGWFILKIFGFTFSFLFLTVLYFGKKYRKPRDINKNGPKKEVKYIEDLTEKELNDNIASFLILKKDGIHSKNSFLSWEDVVDYSMKEDWLFIESMQKMLYSYPLVNLIEEEVEDLIQVMKDKTKMEISEF